MIRINILLFLFGYLGCNTESAQTFVPCQNSGNLEGVVKFHNVNFQADTQATVRDFHFKVWYHDQAVIVENVVVMFDLLPDKTSKQAYIKPLSYVYYDYQNAKAQSYSIFDDEMKPDISFVLKATDLFTFDFIGRSKSTIDPVLNGQDTVINGVLFKRKLYEYVFDDWKQRAKNIYLLQKMKQPLPVHLNPGMDRKFFPYQVVKVDNYVNDELVRSFYMEIESLKLSSSEKKIFQSWEKNIRNEKSFSTYLQFRKFYAEKEYQKILKQE